MVVQRICPLIRRIWLIWDGSAYCGIGPFVALLSRNDPTPALEGSAERRWSLYPRR